MNRDVAKAYDQLAYDYEHHVDQTRYFNTEYERPAMMARMPNQLQNKHVLDAGCAAGWYTEQFLERGADVSAVDLSLEMVRATKRRVGEQATVMKHDLADTLPFADRTFDIIVSSLVLHYIKDWQTVFRDYKRLLKPGGLLIYSVHHPMMDISLSKHAHYFQKEYIVDHWERHGKWIDVPFYRRPMEMIINDTTTFFKLQHMIEPQPTDIFKKEHPEKYTQLQRRPNFLIIQAKRE